MRHYEMRTITYEGEEEVDATCDGCGVSKGNAEFGSLIEVVIIINEGEEFGGRDELDFCDPCLVERAPAFRSVGSTVRLILEEDDPRHNEDPTTEE